ncbi:MAG: hypothetical protein ACPLRO_10800, partial [Candidatus Kapaibacteriota bacterium]
MAKIFFLATIVTLFIKIESKDLLANPLSQVPLSKTISQPEPEATKKKAKKIQREQDSLFLPQIDTTNKPIQTKNLSQDIDKEKKKEDTVETRTTLDDIIKFKAQDSIRLNIKEKHLFMRGKSQVEYKTQKLEAEIIEFFFD